MGIKYIFSNNKKLDISAVHAIHSNNKKLYVITASIEVAFPLLSICPWRYTVWLKFAQLYLSS